MKIFMIVVSVLGQLYWWPFHSLFSVMSELLLIVKS